LVDIDGDGHLDILSGSYSRMEQDMAGLFQVLYGKGDGTFRPAEVLMGTDGKPLIIPTKGKDQITEKICTRPFAVDWDGDGHLDLVVGNFAGTFYWFKGEGKGRFRPEPQLIMAGDSPLRIPGAHSDPVVIDWDGDGDLDILSGSSDGGVYWAENVAGKGKPPVLRPFRPLIKPGRAPADGQILKEGDLTGPTHATRIWVDDVNGDGKLDILVGDCVTLISPAKGVSEEEFKKRFASWKEDFKAASTALGSAAKDAKAQARAAEEYNRIYQRRAEFMKEEMTGFVWLYLQK
jgi:hypothetical protein